MVVLGQHAPSRRGARVSAVGVLATLSMTALSLVGCGGGGGLDCSQAFPNCTKVRVPDGAGDCSQAKCEACQSGLEVFEDAQGSFCGLKCHLDHCSSASAPSRGAASCSQANVSCLECDDTYEKQLDTKTLLPTGFCSFKCTDKQVLKGCAPRSCTDSLSCVACLPGFRLQASSGPALLAAEAQPGETNTSSAAAPLRFLAAAAASDAEVGQAASHCIPEDQAVPMTFYMYRAQKNIDYPPENADLASAAGVIWYLHNEVVARRQTCPPMGRHYDITRVLRYRVTVQNTQAVFNHPPGRRQIGHFVQFDYGQCTIPGCEGFWEQYGYMVGCQTQAFQQYYAGASENPCNWYSLPGSCPSKRFDAKTQECVNAEPGGRCQNPDGSRACTWNYEPAGEVLLDELSGIADYKEFCDAGNYEYDDAVDGGRGTSFWDKKADPTRGRDRVQRFLQLFAAKYPTNESSLELPDPVCDGW